ncbi:uncharacterized protein F4817DRAFT_283286 [Daldinia loculata]|uniref:uncharacterized protein n=1 Tax=Daldinia loculata TaxID=103429 RepID=UPI0020C52F54|nr:uncharacterized protein F4817DRAFT_283286 [Daldinia loculata]KAI1650233.1 hypothetical protein F4817DRAFT_283286 [Daldinia loculata]
MAIPGFQNEFKNITRGSDLLLRWEANATDYPLVLYSRLINQTSEFGANSLEVNITIGLNTTSFLWESIPYPLPYLETAKYEVEVWPQNQVRSKISAPAIASSSYFAIAKSDGEETVDDPINPFNGTTILPSRPTNQPTSNNGVNNNTAIAAGLLVPVFVILAVLGFVWMQRRQKKIIEEKRKQREELYID